MEIVEGKCLNSGRNSIGGGGNARLFLEDMQIWVR